MYAQNKDYTDYESEGIRFMEQNMDAQARRCFDRAVQLGSSRAQIFLRYLDLNVSDADFAQHACGGERFDYDLQPLYRVSRVQAVLKKCFRNILNRAEFMADDFIWRCRIAIVGKTVSRGISM